MRVAYCRVSTLEQNTARQEIAMKELYVDTMFIEKASGKNTDRPELKKMLSFVRSGDTLFIESISRLARSVKDLLNIVEVLKSKHVALVSLKENFDTATPQGKFMLTIFAAMAELERETTLQRQAEGIAAARLAGKRFGRPALTVPDNFSDIVSEWMSGQISAVQAMQKLNMKKTAFYKAVKMVQVH
jgi:DNA invertase Pin-like site-specific DNA recombinase